MKQYLVQTLGCQMNAHDSRRMEEVLEASGWVATDALDTADLVIVNTCSVREKAEHKLLSLLGTFKPLKQAKPNLLIAVTGCVAQQEGEKLQKRAPHVDLVLGPDNIPDLPELLSFLEAGGPPLTRTVFDLENPEFLIASPRAGRTEITSYVTVMKGCDERCTYCIVPYTRGPERYRPADEIVREIAGMVDGGVREVTLLGQTVNSWFEPVSGSTATKDSEFAALLFRIADEVKGLARLRYTSPHPRHLTPELIRAHSELDVVCDHLHLPVQSGSNRVLRRMLRRYTREEYLTRIGELRAACPSLTLATDMIVGFPGETEEDFLDTLSLVREAGFVAAFGFKYSQRPFTPALKLQDDVPEQVKEERLSRFFEVVEEQQNAHLARLAGTRQTVLLESESRDGSPRLTGRTYQNEIVHVDFAPGVELGAIVEVSISQANKHSLIGKLETVKRAAAPFVVGHTKAKRILGPKLGGSAAEANAQGTKVRLPVSL